MTAPDLAGARLLLHRRDAALDEPYGEGVEVKLHLLPDGRLYQERYRYHIDFDGSNDDRFLSQADAIQLLASHGESARAAALFPASVEARWHARFGTCRGSDLDAARVLPGAEVVWFVGAPRDGDAPAFVAHAAGDDLWVVERSGRRSVERPQAALRALLEHDGPAATLERWFPDAAPVRLLRRLGAASWGAAAAALHDLVRSSARVHAWDDERGPRLLARLGPGELLLEEQDGATTRYRLLDAVDAAPLVNGLVQSGAATAEVLERAFPEPGGLREALLECQRRAGISFPGA